MIRLALEDKNSNDYTAEFDSHINAAVWIATLAQATGEQKFYMQRYAEYRGRKELKVGFPGYKQPVWLNAVTEELYQTMQQLKSDILQAEGDMIMMDLAAQKLEDWLEEMDAPIYSITPDENPSVFRELLQTMESNRWVVILSETPAVNDYIMSAHYRRQ